MFWIISALLILIAFAFVLPPLFRKSEEEMDSRSQQNVLIVKEQLAELETRFEKSEIDEETYQETRDELELTLFTDVNQEDDSIVQSTSHLSSWSLAFVIIVFVPLATVLFYLKVGTTLFTDHLDPKEAIAAYRDSAVPKTADGTPDIATMIVGLEKKLKEDPDNINGWYMLGRSYMMMNKYPKAVESYEAALKIKPDAVGIMLALADSLSMINKGQISGRPISLINKALELEPENVMALWLGGMAARQVGNHAQAIQRWEKVLKYLKDPQEKSEVQSLITEAKKALATGKSNIESTAAKRSESSVADVKATKTEILVKVSLSDAVKDQVSPQDTVFIYATASEGSPMPLAAIKLQVKDLPKDVVLNDEMAMMGNMKLSSQAAVTVGAKVSKSGNASSKKNTLFTEKRSVKLGSKIDLVIQ